MSASDKREKLRANMENSRKISAERKIEDSLTNELANAVLDIKNETVSNPLNSTEMPASQENVQPAAYNMTLELVPQRKEKKESRITLLLTPTNRNKLEKLSKMYNISINELVNQMLDKLSV